MAYVVPIKDASGLDGALDELTRLPDVSLVCAPGLIDASGPGHRHRALRDMGDRFAVLDGVAGHTPLKADGALQKQRAA